MAELTLLKSIQSNIEKGQDVWAISEQITTGETGNNIILPEQAGKIDTWIVFLKITGGSGKVQITIDENKIEWFDWDAGDVTTDTTDVLYGVTAVRGVNISGTVEIFVKAY